MALVLSGNGTIGQAGNTSAITIGNDGSVTNPAQPAFQAYYGVDGTNQGVGVVKYAATLLNARNGYDVSTGRFTAMVAGAYYFFANVQAHTAGDGGYISLYFRKNGSTWGVSEFVESHAGGAEHRTPCGAAVISLAIGDYVDVYASRGCRKVQCGFCGFLIG